MNVTQKKIITIHQRRIIFVPNKKITEQLIDGVKRVCIELMKENRAAVWTFPSETDLAYKIGTSRELVHYGLKKLEEEGVLTSQGQGKQRLFNSMFG